MQLSRLEARQAYLVGTRHGKGRPPGKPHCGELRFELAQLELAGRRTHCVAVRFHPWHLPSLIRPSHRVAALSDVAHQTSTPFNGSRRGYDGQSIAVDMRRHTTQLVFRY